MCGHLQENPALVLGSHKGVEIGRASVGAQTCSGMWLPCLASGQPQHHLLTMALAGFSTPLGTHAAAWALPEPCLLASSE